MEFTQALHELWRQRFWVAVGVLLALLAGLSIAYRISFAPPALETKSLAIGVADTQILIDRQRSALTDLDVDLQPLSARASVYTRFMTSLPVREAIADEVGIPVSELFTEAPIQAQVPKAATEPVSAERADQLLGENTQYRLRFETDTGLPTVKILAEAPTAEDAVRLADGAAAGFTKYVQGIQEQQRIPDLRRAEIRQLGDAQGGLIAEDINVRLAVIVGIASFIGWCLLVLLGSSVARNLRVIRSSEAAGDTGGSAA